MNGFVYGERFSKQFFFCWHEKQEVWAVGWMFMYDDYPFFSFLFSSCMRKIPGGQRSSRSGGWAPFKIPTSSTDSPAAACFSKSSPAS